MRKIILYIVLIFFVISCKQDNQNNNFKKSKINFKDLDVEKDNTLKKYEKEDSLKILMSKLDEIKILNFKKGYMENSLPDSLICESWLLKKNDLVGMIKKTKQIDSSDLHYLFETQTCIYNGDFELNGKVYTFGINSGGWLHIQFGNIVLGCFNNGCEDYFIGRVDKPEEEFKKNN